MRRRILVGLLALLTVPLAAQTPAPLQVPYQQFRLANGLNVIMHRDTSIPAVAVNVWYYVGSANEKAGRTGFAHLFEHLMFEGSKHVPEGQFDILLEGAGGDNNGSTTNDRTNYVIDVPSNALELALSPQPRRRLAGAGSRRHLRCRHPCADPPPARAGSDAGRDLEHWVRPRGAAAGRGAPGKPRSSVFRPIRTRPARADVIESGVVVPAEPPPAAAASVRAHPSPCGGDRR